MSYVTTRRFVLASNVNTPNQEYNDMINITSSNDVFDRLVDVRDSVTGEEGTLLCSHMCNFPSHLARQATWFAGCKPSSDWENDDRLALGFHPNHYIQWRIFKETNEIELYLTGGWSNPESTAVSYAGGGDDDGDLEFLYTDLPFANTFFGYESSHDFMEDDNRPEPFSKSLIRLAKSVLLDRVTQQVTQETLNNFECLIHRLFNSGRIDAWTASVFPSSMLTRCLHRDVYHDRIHWLGRNDMFFPKTKWLIKADLEGERDCVIETSLQCYVDGGYKTESYILVGVHSLENISEVYTSIAIPIAKSLNAIDPFDIY